jgi:hypothetical protein
MYSSKSRTFSSSRVPLPQHRREKCVEPHILSACRILLRMRHERDHEVLSSLPLAHRSPENMGFEEPYVPFLSRTISHKRGERM